MKGRQLVRHTGTVTSKGHPDFRGNSILPDHEPSTVPMSCIVLAGGKATRLGRDKTFENIGHTSLLHRVLACLSYYGGEITIVTAENKLLPQLDDFPGLKITTDIYPNKGPLGGIHSGLTASNSLHNLVVACDMPFLNRDLVSYMMQLSDGFDIVIPRFNGMVEPLHAIYSKECLAAMEHLLNLGRLSLLQLLKLVRVRYVESEEIDKFDPEHLSFLNINTEADLERARKLLAANDGLDKELTSAL